MGLMLAASVVWGDLGRGGGGEADLWNFATESAHNADGVEVGCEKAASRIWTASRIRSLDHHLRLIAHAPRSWETRNCHGKLVSHR